MDVLPGGVDEVGAPWCQVGRELPLDRQQLLPVESLQSFAQLLQVDKV